MPRKIIYKFCQRYIKRYEGFSYDFEKNGERLLIEKLSDLEIKTVFDVGANVGSWTKMALQRFPSAMIHSFELSKSTYGRLCNEISDQTRAKLNNFGLSNKEESIVYKDYGANAGGNTILVEADFHDSRTKPTLLDGRVATGDLYCTENKIGKIDFLKIDVEGAENLVLYGFERMLRESNIRLVQFEYGYNNGDAHFLMKDFYKFFAKYGYDVGVLKTNGAIFSDFNYKLNDFNSGPNFVAISNSDNQMREAISDPRYL